MLGGQIDRRRELVALDPDQMEPLGLAQQLARPREARARASRRQARVVELEAALLEQLAAQRRRLGLVALDAAARAWPTRPGA